MTAMVSSAALKLRRCCRLATASCSIGPTRGGPATVRGGVETVASSTTIAAGTLPVVGGAYTAAGSLNVSGDNNPLLLLDGASATSPSGLIATAAGTTGTVTMQNNAQWNGGVGVAVGYRGTGTLNIQSGSDFVNDYGSTGDFAGSAGTVNVTGAGSTFANNLQLLVGNSGTGTLNVDSGAQVSSHVTRVGSESTANGAATVTGANSKWTATQDLVVGWHGHGELSILDGGAVQNVGSTIGYWSDLATTSSVRVSGANSTWTNSDSLTIGNLGKGSLLIENGGKVSNTFSIIGQNTGATGSATIDGSGSTWTQSADFAVGTHGNGTLRIQNGGLITNDGGIIAGNAESTSMATITGAGSTWTNAGSLLVGNGGNGTLNVQNGGKVNNIDGYIGNVAGSVGMVSVDGPGSTWTNTGLLYVGNTGAGSLDVKHGATVTNTISYIANNSGGTGIATVADAGSKWTNSGNIYVGGSASGAGGTGALNVNMGGTVEVGNTLKLWGPGTLNINGGTVKTRSMERAVSTLNHNDGILEISGGSYMNPIGPTSFAIDGNTATALPNFKFTNGAVSFNVLTTYIGDERKGALTIESGSTFGTIGSATIGNEAGSAGSATADGAGSRWNVSTDLYSGFRGTGSLSVKNGGVVESSNGYLAYHTGSSGAATVNGIGSVWNTNGTLYVGGYGAGTLRVENGGQVSDFSAGLGAGFNAGSGSIGTATVTGAGSKWINTQDFRVGSASRGILRIEDSGQVLAGSGYIGNNVSSATVTGGGSKWTNSNSLNVGDVGTGSLLIENGGEVSDLNGFIGVNNSSSSGTVTVTGSGSKWLNTGNLIAGYFGNGTLNIQNGGQVTSQTGYVAQLSGSTGNVTVEGTGSNWTNSSNLYVGGREFNAGGLANLNVNTGGTVEVAGTLKLWNPGTLTLSGGTVKTQQFNASVGTINWLSGTLHTTGVTTMSSTLIVDGASTYINDGSIAAPVNVASGGLVKGSGNFGDLVVQNGGKVSPGASPGTLTAAHTVWSGGGAYTWEINRLASQGGVAGNATGWDLWNLGDLDGALSPGQNFKIELQSLNSANNQGALAGWSPTQAQSWMIATATDAVAATAGLLSFLQVDSTQFASFNGLGAGIFSLEARAAGPGSQIWLNFSPGVGIPGDYNNNGFVDAADYTTYRDALGTGATLPNDTTPGTVTTADYAVWQTNFGLGGPSAAATVAVPEPTAVAMLMGCVSAMVLRRRSQLTGSRGPVVH